MRDSAILKSIPLRNSGFSLMEIILAMGFMVVVMFGIFSMIGDSKEQTQKIRGDSGAVSHQMSQASESHPAFQPSSPGGREISNLDAF